MFEKQAHIPRMDGRELFKFAVTKLPETARELCAETNTPLDKIDWFLAHQANYRILQAISQRLELPMERFFINIHKYGNTSSASIPIALDELLATGALKPGQLVLMCALGAGISWGSALVRW